MALSVALKCIFSSKIPFISLLRPLCVMSPPLSSFLSNTNAVRKYCTRDGEHDSEVFISSPLPNTNTVRKDCTRNGEHDAKGHVSSFLSDTNSVRNYRIHEGDYFSTPLPDDIKEPGEGWIPPPFGSIKLNIAVNIHAVTKTVAFRGVFRDHNGEYQGGITMYCGHCDDMEAGLMGLGKALDMAKEKKFEKLMIESDLKKLCDMLNNGPEEVCEEKADEGWEAPPVGFIKINVGATVDPVRKSCAVGVLFRDHNGEVKEGFTVTRADVVDIVEAGLRGVKRGLMLAKEKNYEKVIVETDIKGVVEVFKGNLNIYQ